MHTFFFFTILHNRLKNLKHNRSLFDIYPILLKKIQCAVRGRCSYTGEVIIIVPTYIEATHEQRARIYYINV